MIAIIVGVWVVISVPLALLFARIVSNNHKSEVRPISDPEASHGVKIRHLTSETTQTGRPTKRAVECPYTSGHR